MKIDWKRKLTSRKLWLSVAGFAAGLIIYFGGTEENAERTKGLFMSAASVVAYTLGEGFSDAANTTINNYVKKEDENNELED